MSKKQTKQSRKTARRKERQRERRAAASHAKPRWATKERFPLGDPGLGAALAIAAMQTLTRR